MSNFRIGDKVITKHGTGTIVYIDNQSVLPLCVKHDNWHDGHSCSAHWKKSTITDNSGQWFDDRELTLIENKKTTVLMACSTLHNPERIVGVYSDRKRAETDAKLLRKAMPNRHIAVLDFEETL